MEKDIQKVLLTEEQIKNKTEMKVNFQIVK